MRSRNISLIIGLSLPVLLIGAVSLSIFWSRTMSPPPKMDFIYTVDGGYQPSKEYYVENQRIAVRDRPINPYYYQSLTKEEMYETKIFLHDTVANKSRPITFAEAQKLSVDPSAQSRDGYAVSRGNSSGGFFPIFFYSHDDYGNIYLKKMNHSVRLNLSSSVERDYYNNRFHFLGWVAR